MLNPKVFVGHASLSKEMDASLMILLVSLLGPQGHR